VEPRYSHFQQKSQRWVQNLNLYATLAMREKAHSSSEWHAPQKLEVFICPAAGHAEAID
jgi:hypothetical protein